MKRLVTSTGFALALLVAPAGLAQDVWTVVPSGTNQNLRAVHFVNADVGFVAGDAGTVRRTVNGGLNWTDASPDAGPDLHGIHFFDANTGVVVGDGGVILRTTNGGEDWSPVPSGVEATLQSVSFAGNVGIAGGTSQTIIRSLDAGVSWDTVQTDFFGGGFPGAHMLDATHAYVAGTNSIFQPLVGVSDNGASTFDFTAFYLNSNEGNLTDVFFLDANTGLTTAAVWDGRGAISRSVNGGQDWTTTIFDQVVQAVDFATDVRGYAVGFMPGLLVTHNGGMSWESTPPILSSELHDVDIVTPSAGFAVGSSGTILKGVLSTASAPEPEAGLLALDVAPNPAADDVSIRFSLPNAGDVSLKVYDALGRRVAVLLEGTHASGVHERSADVSGLRPGLYLVVLEAGSSRTTRTVTVR
jgi:photosystem II stability/assembly factor-like uncharacterized protein